MTPQAVEVESAIEQKFVDEIAPSFRSDLKLWSQVRCSTYGGDFRVDFVVRASGRVVVIECDGRQYHDTDKDRRRDLAILDETETTDIVRLRGCDIVFDSAGCVARLRECVPFLFRADAPVPADDIDVLILVGASFSPGPVKPILRTKVNLEALRLRVDDLRAHPAISICGNCADGKYAVVQLKSPSWDWKYRAPLTWSMGDTLSTFSIDDLIAPSEPRT